jgi:serine/threonine protein kinase
MAELQLARATGIEGFEKLLVIKRILPHLARNSDFVRMFLDEARIAATLHHPNIVQVYDIGSHEGDYFFTMEYLHGEDVRTIVKAARTRQTQVPLEHALSIILGVCAALHHAHGAVGLDGAHRGIIHRDVSPQNVIVTFDGAVKLVDFGIAKAARRLTETREGTLKGKLQYMSPEQCMQQPLDPRSDVFAVAIMLWELTVGRQLYSFPSEFEILKAIVETDVTAPRAIVPEYPEALEQIVLKGLRRNRDERYQSAQEMQADLEGFAREQRLAVSPIGLERYMKELFGDRMGAFTAARRGGNAALVEHVMQAIDLRTSPGVDADHTIPDTGRAKRERSDSLLVPRSTRSVAPGRRSRAGLLFALGGLGLLAAGGGLAYTRMHAEHATPPPSVVPVEPKAPSEMASPVIAAPLEPAQPAVIAIALRKDPVEAKVTLDQVAVADDWLRFPDDGHAHTVHVSATNYQPKTLTVDGKSDRTLYVFLKRSPAPVATPAKSPKRPTTPTVHTANHEAPPKQPPPKPLMPALDP